MNTQDTANQSAQGMVHTDMTTNENNHPEKAYKQKTAWVYLLNLIFYFIPIWFMRDDVMRVSISLLLLIPFLYGYFWAYKSSQAKAIYPISLMISTAVIASLFTSGGISFLVLRAFLLVFLLITHQHYQFYRHQYWVMDTKLPCRVSRILFPAIRHVNRVCGGIIWCSRT
ncbi:hypothetical protein [Shewanella sp. ENK2]|uniref:hypothetical protein n=1 Tax=Shewanella sp. ENK2 TaxID=2775245 RepID=UPI003748D038